MVQVKLSEDFCGDKLITFWANTSEVAVQVFELRKAKAAIFVLIIRCKNFHISVATVITE